MIKSFVNVKFGKMGRTILIVIVNMLLLNNGVSSICVHVPNDDMIEYSCVSGNPSDLYTIPERAEKIRIANMSLPRITSETFSRFGDNLWVLTCSHCGITIIEPHALKSLVNLQQLRLDNNRLRSVEASWFDGMNYLTYLDLNYNEITAIEDGVYKNLPSLVDFRISGNRLECLNIDAMSNLVDLKRIFLSKNPDFKCPNGVSKFLDDRNVNFERDPEWRRIPQDLIPASAQNGRSTQDWRSRPVYPPSTTPYHEKLISRTTEDPDYYYDYETSSTRIPSQGTPGSFYPNRGWSSPSPAPYPTREWPTPVPASNPTTRESPTSMPNFYPTRVLPTSQPTPMSYPTRGWPTPAPTDYYPNYDGPEWRESTSNIDVPSEFPSRIGVSGNSNYPLEIVQTSTIDYRHIPKIRLPPYVESGGASVWTSEESATPGIVWAGNSAEIFSETDYPPFETIATDRPNVERHSSSMDGYPVNVYSIPSATDNPTYPEEIPSRSYGEFSEPQILDKYQEVQEPVSVTIPPMKKETDKPMPECSGSSTNFGASIVILAIGIVIRPFITIL